MTISYWGCLWGHPGSCLSGHGRTINVSRAIHRQLLSSRVYQHIRAYRYSAIWEDISKDELSGRTILFSLSSTAGSAFSLHESTGPILWETPSDQSDRLRKHIDPRSVVSLSSYEEDVLGCDLSPWYHTLSSTVRYNLTGILLLLFQESLPPSSLLNTVPCLLHISWLCCPLIFAYPQECPSNLCNLVDVRFCLFGSLLHPSSIAPSLLHGPLFPFFVDCFFPVLLRNALSLFHGTLFSSWPFSFSVNLPISPTFSTCHLPSCFWVHITPLSLFLLKQLGFVYLYEFLPIYRGWSLFSMISKFDHSFW